jgi:hypothetical protein
VRLKSSSVTHRGERLASKSRNSPLYAIYLHLYIFHSIRMEMKISIGFSWLMKKGEGAYKICRFLLRACPPFLWRSCQPVVGRTCPPQAGLHVAFPSDLTSNSCINSNFLELSILVNNVQRVSILFRYSKCIGKELKES